MDVLGGQEKSSDNNKGSDSTGDQQGYYPCMNNNNNWDVMLNSLQGGGLLPFHRPYRGLSLGLSHRYTTTNSI
jgi:hypothetical protein